MPGQCDLQLASPMKFPVTSARAAVVVVPKPAHLDTASFKLQLVSEPGWCSNISHDGKLLESTVNSRGKGAYSSTKGDPEGAHLIAAGSSA